MLIATSSWRQDSASVDTLLALGDVARWHLVRRDGLVVDTRFVVPGDHPAPRAVVTIHVMAGGWVAPGGSARVEGRSAWLLPENEFERVGPQSSTFVSGGAPYVGLQVCVPTAWVRGPIGLSAGPYPFPPAVFDALDALERAREGEDAGPALRAFARALAADGAIDPAIATDLEFDEPPHLRRVWNVIAGLYRAQNTSAYVKALATASQLSIRQTERDLADLSRRLGIGDGFRSTVRVLRLRRATMLLGARDASVGSVARVVGYGSPDAMGRAFRDAGLPTPSAVREHLLRVT